MDNIDYKKRHYKYFLSARPYNVYYFIELMTAIMILKEEGCDFSDKRYTILRLKKYSELDLMKSKDFYDLMIALGFINGNYLSDYIYDINKVEQLEYMLDNGINVNLLMRKDKIKKLKDDIEYKNIGRDTR